MAVLLHGLGIAIVQVLGLFVVLSAYAAMWRGAQVQRGLGWLVAVLWSLGLLLLIRVAGALRLLF